LNRRQNHLQVPVNRACEWKLWVPQNHFRPMSESGVSLWMASELSKVLHPFSTKWNIFLQCPSHLCLWRMTEKFRIFLHTVSQKWKSIHHSQTHVCPLRMLRFTHPEQPMEIHWFSVKTRLSSHCVCAPIRGSWSTSFNNRGPTQFHSPVLSRSSCRSPCMYAPMYYKGSMGSYPLVSSANLEEMSLPFLSLVSYLPSCLMTYFSLFFQDSKTPASTSWLAPVKISVIAFKRPSRLSQL
jgi:hypothetical protein